MTQEHKGSQPTHGGASMADVIDGLMKRAVGEIQDAEKQRLVQRYLRLAKESL